MKSVRGDLAPRYTRALEKHLEGAGEVALQEAYKIGREALAGGLGVVEMVELHHEAMLSILRRQSPARPVAQSIRAAGGLLVESLSLFEMTHREFREANEALRRWNSRLEEEARRIARALHDEAGQLLASVHLALEDVARELKPPALDRLREVRGYLERIEEQMRQLSHELRPTILDDLGLLPAIEFLSRGITSRTGLPIVVEGSTEGRLPVLIETALYRIAQEALSNAARHAKASRATVQVRREPAAIRCVVRDDGAGFDVSAVLTGKGDRGLGFIGIRERLTAVGGTLEICSSPGRGTELLAAIPLEE